MLDVLHVRLRMGQVASLVLEPNSSLKFERFPDELGTSMLGEKCVWGTLVFGLEIPVCWDIQWELEDYSQGFPDFFVNRIPSYGSIVMNAWIRYLCELTTEPFLRAKPVVF